MQIRAIFSIVIEKVTYNFFNSCEIFVRESKSLVTISCDWKIWASNPCRERSFEIFKNYCPELGSVPGF